MRRRTRWTRPGRRARAPRRSRAARPPRAWPRDAACARHRRSLSPAKTPFRCLRGELTGSRRKVALHNAWVAIRPSGLTAAMGPPFLAVGTARTRQVQIRSRTSKQIGATVVPLHHPYGGLAARVEQIVDDRDDVDRLALEAARARLGRLGRLELRPLGLAAAQPYKRRHHAHEEGRAAQK